MNNFILGLVAGVMLLLAFFVANKPTDALISQLYSAMNDDDQKTLQKLTRFKLHRIIEIVFIAVIFFIGFMCRGVIK